MISAASQAHVYSVAEFGKVDIYIIRELGKIQQMHQQTPYFLNVKGCQ